ncbi:hypothetical protein FZC84_01185 [Rossellomorea vietnamensis]|uniref:Uncharacterized protein n=1 Tax=Rossellomorea vietnamensis TaxID=218284 RepID=A0A5D4MI14_9BACI|nr:hypothetical protein [Rossellomorea vietnamensis]TYS01302.1 hypothetical protein FZC84_01185 [Rossellomorea vietnamensis]
MNCLVTNGTKNQLVINEGFGNTMTVTNQDVTIDHDSLKVLDQHMGEFNKLIFLGILFAALFIATYWLLLSEKWRDNEGKRKKFLYWTLSLNGVTIAAAIIIFVQYYYLLNDAYHNVLF